ncbi:glycosyltransferase [Pseudochelatococcus lubricantis]|uniref:glycosyltransferase n=1 Tax=Pseudochelatococcus lubricantis TaxID=1538102 RepID=UPI0035ED58F8
MTSRVLIAVTHLLGVGHLARAAALARGLAAAGNEVTLISGGAPAPLVAMDGVRLVQLPPVHIVGTAFSALLGSDGAPAGDTIMEERRRLMMEAVAGLRPDVVITELFPFGRRVLADEFLALAGAARALVPRAAILSSVRDVLVAPSKPGRLEEAHARLLALYDGVLVHGDAAVLPLERSWPVAAEIAPLLHYTGYIDDRPVTPAGEGADGAGEIVVSGGGSAASLPLFRAALGAARSVAGHRWRLLVGRGVPEEAFAALAGEAPAHMTVERARADFPALLARAALSVSQAGYNTVIDIVRARVRAVVVPFEAGRETEQRLRAESLAEAGVWPFAVVPEAGLSAQALAQAVTQTLARPLPPEAAIDRDGVAASVALVARFAQARCRRFPALSRALDEVAAGGGSVALWWRDDDAVAPTPALDRLLALAAKHALPVAIAAIPAHATQALADRLAGEPLASVLVHGLSHANHAPEGKKKAEFGPHRPLAALCKDAAEGLRRAGETFGARLLPVFVPPWNRVSDDLAVQLAACGFAGLSAAGKAARPDARRARGLAIAHTHIDPIDWHGGGGLLPLAQIDDRAALAVRARAAAGGEIVLGLLTHHLAQDEATWAFCDDLLAFLLDHPAVVRADARRLFREAGEEEAWCAA